MWSIGQKVRCINGTFPPEVKEWGSNLPHVGGIYTIRAISLVEDHFTRETGPSFLLEELKNPYDRLRFDTRRFEPLEPFKAITMEDLNLTEAQMESFIKGARHVFGPPQED